MRLAPLLAALLLGLALPRAQQPHTPPPPPSPVPAPAPVPFPSPTPGPGQEPTREPPPPSAAPQEPARGDGERGRGERGADRGERAERGERRRGGAGSGGGDDTLQLPAFTPVAAPPVAALQGKQFFWFTMYPHFLVQYDPATDAVAKKVELKRGMFWSTQLTHDRKRMLVVTDQQQTIEVVDLASGTVTAEHPFHEQGFVLRVRDVRECPGGAHWLVRTDRIKKEIDRYSFEPSPWLLYDVTAKKVLRKVRRLPESLERGAQLAADGAQWLAQDDDGNLLFLDGRTLQETARIDLATPRYFGAGAIRLSGNDLLDRRDPNRALMLYTTTDPVETRRTSWGVVELDLAGKRVVSATEWGPSQNSFGLRIAHKKRVAAAMSGSFGGGGGGERDTRTRLVMLDLQNGQKLAEAFEEFRPRRSLVAISPDGDKVYIGTAGSDFEVFDANLKRVKTVELEGEIVGRIHVVDG